MSTKIKTSFQVMPANRALIMGLITILAALATTGFLWMQSENIIAPPGLRMLSWLWTAFDNVLFRLYPELYMRALSGLI